MSKPIHGSGYVDSTSPAAPRSKVHTDAVEDSKRHHASSPVAPRHEAESRFDPTPLARELQQIRHSLEAIPIADSARVLEMKTALEQGSYEVNPEKIAKGLLETEVELLLQGFSKNR